MSLIKQLWLAILLAMTIAFGGSLVVSVLSARLYLQQELKVKNLDNASALALSLTQLPKDPVTVELQLSAAFDTGHYRFIRIVSPTGAVLVERVFNGKASGAPEWFMWLFPIQAPAGQAQVQDGWKQYGTVSLATHEQYAYKSLWDGSLVLLLWFVVGSLGTGVAGSLVLRFITRPLKDVVAQAEGIAQRRFVHIAEPRTPELRSVARAMNSMVERLVILFNEEAERVESLRQKAHLDPLTGLATRAHFTSSMRDLLSSEAATAEGVLLGIRVVDVGRLNDELGEARTDALIQQLAEHLQQCANDHAGQLAGRLKGGEFALAWPGEQAAAEAAAELHGRLASRWLPEWAREVPELFHLAAIPYRRGQPADGVLDRLDEALARAQAQGPNAWYAGDADTTIPARPTLKWRRLLRKAVSRGRLRLVFYPVVAGESGALLHQEAVVRLLSDEGDRLLTAGEFMPMAVHLNVAPKIDLQVARLGLEHLRGMAGDLAINLSAEAIADFGFRHEFQRLLEEEPQLAERLMVEVPEAGVFRHFDAFRDLIHSLKPLGCRVGIEHFGHRFAEGHKLVDLALDYVKVHPSYVQGVAGNADNQAFLQGLCRMAHNLGITVIALGVETPADIQALVDIGFDGVTGPAVQMPPGGDTSAPPAQG